MRAQQISELGGPDSMRVAEVAEPPAEHFTTPGGGVLIEVAAAGLSFPDVLQARGEYQFRPPLPYVPGGEVAGTVLSSTDARFVAGQRVAALTTIGALAERVVAPPELTFPLHGSLTEEQGAALIMNYHTALFALRVRGRVGRGDFVLVHGAAGGVGTASLQVARALGASTIAVVSSDEKERLALGAGADTVVRSGGAWKDEARELSGGGVDAVLDPVGGDRMLDSLRALRRGGRMIVVGFAGGAIPEVKVNRLLLNNIDVVGAGLGAWLAQEPRLARALGEELETMTDLGFVRPVVGATLTFEQAAEGLRLLESRAALGKVVVSVGA